MESAVTSAARSIATRINTTPKKFIINKDRMPSTTNMVKTSLIKNVVPASHLRQYYRTLILFSPRLEMKNNQASRCLLITCHFFSQFVSHLQWIVGLE